MIDTNAKLPPPAPAAWSLLVEAIEQLSAVQAIDQIVEIVRVSARRVSGADGVTFVLRDDDKCHYVDENAIGPLWKGQKFPMSACISGWAMLNKRAAIVPDIYADPRIPHDAYRPTFVKSLLMVPVRVEDPLAAIGVYWARWYEPTPHEVEMLQSLARATATALANVALHSSLREAADRAAAQAHEIGRLFEDSQREAAQRAKAEDQLRQAQKMEALGNLTGGMAHDFNNLLGIIIGNLDFLQPLVKQNAEADELTTACTDAALRGADLVRRLLAFARRQPLQPKRIAVNDLVSSVAKLLDRILGERIPISLDLAPSLWPVVVDPAQLESAIINLATNARDAMPDGGRLTIVTANRQLDDDYAATYPDARPGDHVMIEIGDSGVGMAPEVLARIFEPFFTTKEPGKGTGLGLAMVFGFVRQSGGHINVYSELGRGTIFRLYLPREDQAVVAEEPLGAPARGAGETVLVVEDNSMLRRVAVRQLGELGYTVLAAENASAALEMLDRGGIDLLFSDVVIPGPLNGAMLARAARERWPGLKVLLTSGFPDAAAIAGLRLLPKPYRRDELARALREVLEAPAASAGG